MKLPLALTLLEAQTVTPPAHMTEKNLMRLDRILAKMRKAGISESDIEFLGKFYADDASHVDRLIAVGEANRVSGSRRN